MKCFRFNPEPELGAHTARDRFFAGVLFVLAVSGWVEGQHPSEPKQEPPRSAIHRFGTTAFSHSTRITSVEFSPDDRWVVSADGNGIVRVWDSTSGNLILEKANGGGRAVAFAPDGNTIAIGGYYNQQIIFWDLQKNEYVSSIKQNARSLKYSADGSVLVAAGEDTIVRVWNPKTRKLIRKLEGHQAGLYAIAISPDGTQIASAGGRGGYSTHNEVRVWGLKSGELQAVLDDPFEYYEKLPDAVYDLAFSRDGKTLGAAGPYVVRLWDVERKKVIDRLRKSSSAIGFSPTENRFVAAGQDLELLDQVSRTRIAKMAEVSGTIDVIRYSHDGKRIATGDRNGFVRLWDAATGKEIELRHGHTGGVRAVSFSPDGKLLASISRKDSTIRVWGLSSGAELTTIQLDWKGSDVWWNEEGSDLFFIPHRRDLMTWTHDANVHVWRLGTEKTTRVKLGTKRITALTFSPDGNLAATVEYDGGSNIKVAVYQLDGAKMIAYIDPFADSKGSDRWIASLAFSPDNQSLAIGCLSDSLRDQPENSVQIWNLKNVELQAIFREAEAPPGRMVFSPSGKWLATSASRGADLQVWDVEKGQPLRDFKKVDVDAHGRDPAPLAFSTDGKLMAAAGANREIHVWETLTWSEIKTFRGHQKAVTSVQFSPDGKTLASSSEDTTVLLWAVKDLKPDSSRYTKSQLDKYWQMLGHKDGELASLAMKSLQQNPDQAVELFDERLNVGTRLDEKDLPTLIKKLLDEDPMIHLPATLQLREYGKSAVPFLFKQLNQSNSKLQLRRVENLLAELNRFPVSPKALRRTRAIQILEQIGNEVSRSLLKKMAESKIRTKASLDAKAALIRLDKLNRLQAR